MQMRITTRHSTHGEGDLARAEKSFRTTIKLKKSHRSTHQFGNSLHEQRGPNKRD